MTHTHQSLSLFPINPSLITGIHINGSTHFFSKVVLKIAPVLSVLCSNECAKICTYFFIQAED
jgi:hypothetical protein